jgi:hypothetical protein
LPEGDTGIYDGYYNTSPECWSVYTEVLGTEFGNAFLFGQVHQLTVDTYAVQHAGASHKDKSVAVHLVGLHLVLDLDIRPPRVPPYLQRFATAVTVWPHFVPPANTGPLTVCDVGLANSVAEHMDLVRKWAVQLWEAWSPHHAEVIALAERHLTLH